MVLKATSPYSQQWGQLFLLLSSNAPISKTVVEALVREALPDWQFEPFASYATTTQVQSDSAPGEMGGDTKQMTGPWAGREGMPGTSVMALKAVGRTVKHNILLESPTGETDLGRARDKIRSVVYPKLQAIGVYPSYLGFSPVGVASKYTQGVDKGLPPDLSIPPEPPGFPWLAWLSFLGMGGLAAVLIKKQREER